MLHWGQDTRGSGTVQLQEMHPKPRLNAAWQSLLDLGKEKGTGTPLPHSHGVISEQSSAGESHRREPKEQLHPRSSSRIWMI